MSKLYVMCGIAGSGKSTMAEKIKNSNPHTIIISSDELRRELLGSEENQNNNELIFQKMRNRTKKYLDMGLNVVYDSTNLSSKRRKALVNNFKKYECICVFMYTNFFDCLMNNSKRERKVPIDVIESMYKRIEVPMWHEGWVDICFETSSELPDIVTSKYSLNDNYSFNDYVRKLQEMKFGNCINLGQDSSYHTLSVDRHMYYAYKKSLELTDNENIILASMFHDIGKPFCKNYKEGSKYANFIGHNNVGAYLMIDKLFNIGFCKEKVVDITTLICLHMKMYDIKDNYKARERLIKRIGIDLYQRLEILHNCDIAGH